MKIKNGFALQEIAGQWVIVPHGQRVTEFNAILSVSESGVVLWKELEDGADEERLVTCLLDTYDIDEPTARSDARKFISALQEKKIIA